MTRRLAVYNLQKRMDDFEPGKYNLAFPWVVCEAPIPADCLAKDLIRFETQAEALEWALENAKPIVVEPA